MLRRGRGSAAVCAVGGRAGARGVEGAVTAEAEERRQNYRVGLCSGFFSLRPRTRQGPAEIRRLLGCYGPIHGPNGVPALHFPHFNWLFERSASGGPPEASPSSFFFFFLW